MNNKELIINLIPLWYASVAWAKKLLVLAFKLEKPEEVLSPKYYNKTHQIPGTNWYVRAHGAGVNVYKTPEVGGIDFDFDKQHPDEWRLKFFFEAQYNDGQLDYQAYHHLADDEKLLEQSIKEALKEYYSSE
jgi:hypothetical protein